MTRLHSLTLGTLIIVTAAACRSDETLSPHTARLMQAEERWSLAGTSSYVMLQRRDCFCLTGGKQYRLTVENNVIVSGHEVESGKPLEAEELTWFRTVLQLFEEIRTAAGKRGMIREVEYHPTAGYPTVLSLDPILQAVDDEVAYHTTIEP